MEPCVLHLINTEHVETYVQLSIEAGRLMASGKYEWPTAA